MGELFLWGEEEGGFVRMGEGVKEVVEDFEEWTYFVLALDESVQNRRPAEVSCSPPDDTSLSTTSASAIHT